IAEFLRYLRAARGAILCGVSRIHLDQRDTGSFSLVPKHRDEPRPRSVVDVFGKSATGEALDVERFDRDHIVVASQASARLMQMVGTTARCCRVAATPFRPRLSTPLGAARLA